MRQFIAPMLALAVTAGTLSVAAQTKSKSSSRSAKATSDAKEASKYRRLPAYFGKLDLDDDQIEDIYSIRGEYGPQIDDLKQELADLQEEMKAEIEDVLTTTQKSLLAKLKGNSRTRSSSKSETKSDSSSSDDDTEKSSRTRRKSSSRGGE